MGNIAYTTREFTYDNPLMQLIRHTIEYIKNQKGFGVLLDSNRENMTEITRVTSSYKLADRPKIIRMNKIKPIRHAYFREYRKLQELCLMILSRESMVLDLRPKRYMAFSLMLPGFGKSMFIPCCQKISSIHEIRIRRTVFRYFLIVKEKYFQIFIIKS